MAPSTIADVATSGRLVPARRPPGGIEGRDGPRFTGLSVRRSFREINAFIRERQVGTAAEGQRSSRQGIQSRLADLVAPLRTTR